MNLEQHHVVNYIVVVYLETPKSNYRFLKDWYNLMRKWKVHEKNHSQFLILILSISYPYVLGLTPTSDIIIYYYCHCNPMHNLHFVYI